MRFSSPLAAYELGGLDCTMGQQLLGKVGLIGTQIGQLLGRKGLLLAAVADWPVTMKL